VQILDKELDAYEKRREGKIDEAIADLVAALEYQSEDPLGKGRTYYLLGQLWEGKGEADKAMDYYNQAIDEIGTVPEAELRIGELLQKRGDKEGALARFKQAADEAGDSYMVHVRLQKAFTDLGQGELAQAEKAWLEKNAPQSGLSGASLPQGF